MKLGDFRIISLLLCTLDGRNYILNLNRLSGRIPTS